MCQLADRPIFKECDMRKQFSNWTRWHTVKAVRVLVQLISMFEKIVGWGKRTQELKTHRKILQLPKFISQIMSLHERICCFDAESIGVGFKVTVY